MEQEVQETKRKRSRSPSYPAIPLDQALERAHALYASERGHPTHVDTALRHWDYRPKSGAGLVAIAALLQFGLLEDEGSGPTRRVRLTDFAQRIIRDDRPESPERDALIREASLRPPIHRELWDRYDGSLPSDDNLRYMLKVDRNFTDSGADAFIREFRRTVEFAKLSETDDVSMSTHENDDYATANEIVSAARPRVANSVADASRRGYLASSSPRAYEAREAQRVVYERARTQRNLVRQLPLPVVSSSEWPVLLLPDRITEADWDQMLAVLLAMKPGIVAKPEPTTGRAESGETESE